jgi:hypothetical protein
MPGMPGAAGNTSGNNGTNGSNGANDGGANGARGGTQNGGQNGGAGGGDIAYGTGDDPFAGLGKPGSGGMSTAERRAALDARLEQSYGTFDGLIIAEREKAQNEASATGSAVRANGEADGAGAGAAGAGGETGRSENGAGEGGGNQPGAGTALVANGGGSNSGGGYMPGPAIRQGEYSNTAAVVYTAPPDIPNATNDDVVARQLREAALREPDPQLREKLWNEYRKYTGLPIPAATSGQ